MMMMEKEKQVQKQKMRRASVKDSQAPPSDGLW